MVEFDDLTVEQKERLKACKTPEEIIALAKEEGVNLTDEQLEGIAGGWGCLSDDGCYPYYTGGRY